MVKQLKQARTALQVSSFSELQKASVHLAFLESLASLQTLKLAITTSASVSNLLAKAIGDLMLPRRPSAEDNPGTDDHGDE